MQCLIIDGDSEPIKIKRKSAFPLISLKTTVPLLSLLLLLAGCSPSDSIPSPELQTRLATETGLVFLPRNPQREAAGYWHFWAHIGTGLDVYVPEGASFDQIKTLSLAKYRIEHPTPAP